jgi:predicted nucleotidyltransferase
MKQSDVISYVFDFLSTLFEKEEVSEKISRVLLYGSVARGNFTKDSDIDLFFEVKNVKDENLNLASYIRAFEVNSRKTWGLKGISLPIKCIVGRLDDEVWANLREEMIGYSIQLYGGFEALPDNLEQYVLFTYSMQNLGKNTQMKFLRKLLGYKLKRNGKTYITQGRLEKSKGIKLGTHSIAVRLGESENFKKLFGAFKVKIQIRHILIKKQ